MQTLTATDARREFFDLVKSAAEKHETFRIHHKKGSVILLAEDDYEELLETIHLLSIPGLKESLDTSRQQADAGETVALEDVWPETP